MNMDHSKSYGDTMRHKLKVKHLMMMLANDIYSRAIDHDNSKLEDPEKSIFDEYTPKLATCTYGSDEYKGFLKGMAPALDHHYRSNRHHPEHFKNGIDDMNLVDLLEMICDWTAASTRHNDGDITDSLEINQKRFGYDDELKQILKNTVKEYFSDPKSL